MGKQKHWIDYRIEEMEEKAGVTQLPTHDMDGSRFQPDEDWETNERDDAYDLSISSRLQWIMDILDPYDYQEIHFTRWAKTIERSTGYSVDDLLAMRIYPLDDFKDGIKPAQFIKDYNLK